jgi:hypothetical protein
MNTKKADVMSPLRAVQALDRISGSDCEEAHIEADRVLRCAVDPRVREAYERLVRRTGGWWYA